MEFQIRRNILSNHLVLQIPEAKFDSIKDAHELIFRSLAREQKYDIVIGNYLDLEKEVFSSSIDYVVHPSLERLVSDRARVAIDRAVTNFLSSARAFIDFSQHRLEPNDFALIHGFYTAQYDAVLAYRTMEALRNYSQHEGSATHALHYKGKWTDLVDGSRKLIHTLVPLLTTDEIRDSKSFKASVLKELDSLQLNEHPIMDFVREYLGCLSTVNVQIRDLFRTREREWVGLLQQAASDYCAADQNSLATGVVAVSICENGSVKDEVHLLSDTEDRLNVLRQANRQLVNLHIRQITT